MIDQLLDQVFHLEFFELCARVPDHSLDLILCDLPYGTTYSKWDEIIPLAPMWKQFNRIVKKQGAIVLTATQPFSSKLVMSAIKQYRYSWYWEKSRVSNVGNAHYQPLRVIEEILVFGKARYFPQGLIPYQKIVNKGKKAGGGIHRSKFSNSSEYLQEFTNYPRNLIFFPSDGNSTSFHPNQKPVPLFEYLISTYTLPGEIVFDPCAGSGTTAIAARNLGRRFIVGDQESEYVDIARDRLKAIYNQPMF